MNPTVPIKMHSVMSAEETGPASSLSVIILIFFVHVLLVWGMEQVPTVATAHALLTLVVGTAVAMGGSIQRTSYSVAYIAGAEVLWRLMGANIFWEFGKYATIVIIMVTLLRSRPTKLPPLALLFFICLLPSTILTVAGSSLQEARELISFNLSGPFSLMICVWIFSSSHYNYEQFENLVLAYTAPVVSIATASLLSILKTTDLVWTTESNKVASGGFGPNQVSSALALGVLLIFLLLLFERVSASKQLMFGFLGLWLLSQTALTFSRGGFVSTAVATAVALLHTLFAREHQRKTLVLTLSSIAIIAFLLFPYLDEVTGGALVLRYSDADLTNRDSLMRDELQVFLDHPFTGVGPGMAKVYRNIPAAAHTEFTRLLAEHGALGAVAILILIVLAVRAYMRPGQTALGRALVAALTLWTFTYMLHSAMRLVDVSFAFGLAFAMFTQPANDASSAAKNVYVE